MLYEGIEQFNLLLKDSRNNEAVVQVLQKLVPAFQWDRHIRNIETLTEPVPAEVYRNFDIQEVIH